MPALLPRYYDDCGYDSYGYYRCRNSSWNNWVRWLVLAIIVVGFFLLFFLCSCFTARRRRRQGLRPYYGTGWAAKPPPYQQSQQPYYNNQPAPPYSAQATDGYQNNTGANQGYYNQQQHGIELQSPQPAYHNQRGGEDVYTPPPGPPPGKV